MAVSISNIELGSDAVFAAVEMGAAAVAGAIYKDTADGDLWKNMDVNAVNADDQLECAILMAPVSARNRFGIAITGGTIYIDTLGVTAKATTFIAGATTAGDIEQDSAAASGWYKVILGVGGTEGSSDTVDEFLVNIFASGRDKA